MQKIPFTQKAIELSSTFFNSSTQNFGQILQVLGNVLIAVGIVLLGWMLGKYAEKLFRRLEKKLKVAKLYQKIGLTHLLQKANIKASAGEIIGKLAKGYIITIFVITAANVLGFTQVSEFLDSVIAYIPNVLIALVIILLGMRIADTSSAILENTLKLAHSGAAKTLALSAKYIIITFAILGALFELKIAEDLVRILFTGFIAMIVLAGGLAFGLGGKEVVREFLDDMKRAHPKK